jgi:CDP-diacylglycerol---serine O-phosphatidyltransferase
MNRVRRLQRGVIILPSAFTLGNLFLGIWAIVSASRGMFDTAAWLIVLAAVADMLDGRIARFTRTGSEFGAELDSLVDAVSFGVAPAMIMYFLFLQEGVWSWTFVFLYVAAAIIRLARFNVEQSGHAKSSFHGLPSPAAGVTLATYYPFSQTAFYQRFMAEWPWHQVSAWLMILVAGLMISQVLYPVVPKFSLRTRKGIITIVTAVAFIVGAFTVPALIFFPASIAYIAYGLIRTAFLGFQDRLPDRDPLLDLEENGEPEEQRELDYTELKPYFGRRGRRTPPPPNEQV